MLKVLELISFSYLCHKILFSQSEIDVSSCSGNILLLLLLIFGNNDTNFGGVVVVAASCNVYSGHFHGRGTIGELGVLKDALKDVIFGDFFCF